MVNLLPWREQLWHKQKRFRYFSVCIVLAWLIVLSLVVMQIQSRRFAQQALHHANMVQENQFMQAKIQMMAATMQPKANAFHLWNELQNRANLLPRTAQILGWLATERPEGMYFQHMTQEKAQISGQDPSRKEQWFRLTGTTPSQKDLDLLVDAWTDQGIQHISITHLQKQNEAMAFTLRLPVH